MYVLVFSFIYEVFLFQVPNTSEIPETSSRLVLILTQSNHIVENFTKKVIFVPPVKHEVFLSDLKDSVIACSAQQIRMRRCENLILYNFVKGSVFGEQKCSKIKLHPYLFHAEGDERREQQTNRRQFATFQSLDNPFNPGACFTVVPESDSSFFREAEQIA